MMIDAKGYRANVGIILTNNDRKLFWGKRAGMDAWQFPQGGIRPNEPVETAMFRELKEETGLHSGHVEIISYTHEWVRYRLPKKYIRRKSHPLCIGQKQRWYLLRLMVDESKVKLDICKKPEFDHWQWIDFWKPMNEVVEFKRKVYKQTLVQFAPILFPEHTRVPVVNDRRYAC